MTPARGESVTLPRWFVVLLLSTITAAAGAFWKLDSQLAGVQARLAVIEWALGITPRVSGISHGLTVPDAAPPAEAAPQPVVP